MALLPYLIRLLMFELHFIILYNVMCFWFWFCLILNANSFLSILCLCSQELGQGRRIMWIFLCLDVSEQLSAFSLNICAFASLSDNSSSFFNFTRLYRIMICRFLRCLIRKVCVTLRLRVRFFRSALWILCVLLTLTWLL